MKVTSVGTLLGAIGLVRIQVLMRRAYAEHPQAMAKLLARLGYTQKPVAASLMIVGFQYVVLRRPFPEIGGTSLERERSEMLIWFAVMFAGVALGMVGIAMEVMERRAI